MTDAISTLNMPAAEADPLLTPFGAVARFEAPTPRDRSYWVVEDRLLAGAYPFAPEPERGRQILDGLLAAGITGFIDLTESGTRPGPEDHLLDYRPYLSGTPGVVALWHPIRDLDVPSVEQHLVTLDAIDGLLAAGSNVYLHCWGGVGRTGLTVATWLMRHVTPDPRAALSLLGRLRGADQVAGRRPAPETRRQVEFVMGWTEG